MSTLLQGRARLNRRGSEAVPDGELEDRAVLARSRRQRETPLEAQRPDRRVPAEAEAERGAQVEGIDQLVAAPGVAGVEEHHAADADLFEDRELDLGVEDELRQAADVD